MTDHSSPENADMSVLAANLEKYAHKCVHIDSPEKIGDLLDAAKFIRSRIRTQCAPPPSYAALADSATTFDPEAQFDADVDCILKRKAQCVPDLDRGQS